MKNYNIELSKTGIFVTNEYGDEIPLDELNDIRYALAQKQKADTNAFLYLLYSKKMGIYKIGYSTDVEQRISSLRNQYHDGSISKIHVIQCRNSFDANVRERLLHNFFSHLRCIEYRDGTNSIRLGNEWFRLTIRDVNFIKQTRLFVQYDGRYIFHPMAYMGYVGNDSEENWNLRTLITQMSEILNHPDFELPITS